MVTSSQLPLIKDPNLRRKAINEAADYRRAHGITQASIAALIGTTQGTIARWELDYDIPNERRTNEYIWAVYNYTEISNDYPLQNSRSPSNHSTSRNSCDL